MLIDGIDPGNEVDAFVNNSDDNDDDDSDGGSYNDVIDDSGDESVSEDVCECDNIVCFYSQQQLRQSFCKTFTNTFRKLVPLRLMKNCLK